MSTSALGLTQHQSQGGVVLPSVLNRCPPGTKVHVLCLGYLQADAAWFLRGANGSLMSNPHPKEKPERRDLPCYACLIDHPAHGLILWETGCGKDYPEIWGAPLNDIFARSRYEEKHELDVAIKNAGYDIKDVKTVVIGHLHLDHAGGLDKFLGRKDVDIWVHKTELESAFYSVATGADAGVYLKHYLDLNLNWKCFDERTVDLFQGITLHHLPGHTAGLIGMQINLINDGTYFFVSDHAHVMENYHGTPQGWLARDHPAWFNSNQRLHRLEAATKGKVIPGHDEKAVAPLFGKVLT